MQNLYHQPYEPKLWRSLEQLRFVAVHIIILVSRVHALGLKSVRVLGSYGLGFRVQVQGSGFRVVGSQGLRVLRFRVQVQGSGFRVVGSQGSGFRFRVQALGLQGLRDMRVQVQAVSGYAVRGFVVMSFHGLEFQVVGLRVSCLEYLKVRAHFYLGLHVLHLVLHLETLTPCYHKLPCFRVQM